MLKTFRQLASSILSPTATKNALHSPEQLHLAAAALMLEVATVDQNLDEKELDTVAQRLQQQLGLTAETTDAMLLLAKEQQSQATSLYQFTSLINENYTDQEKFQLITDMWTVAYADHEIDKYEEYIIRRVAELIYVPHSDFIRAKIAVRDRGVKL